MSTTTQTAACRFSLKVSEYRRRLFSVMLHRNLNSSYKESKLSLEVCVSVRFSDWFGEGQCLDST